MEESSSNRARQSEGGTKWWRRALMLCAAVAILGGTLWQSPQGRESDDPNWRHAAAVSEGGHAMKWIGRSGAVDFAGLLPLGDADRDPLVTNAIRQALLAGEVARADHLFAAAQGISQASNVTANPVDPTLADAVPAPQDAPIVEAPPPTSEPPRASLTTGMREEIMRGDAQFYHIHLYDSCWEDGDVVEILLNGQPMFVVPLTNAGATLTVPIHSGGATVIAVRGVRDGRGGITVACRTSQGDGFVRVMAPGEIQPLGVVLP
jgi:hypothetical protein